MYTRGESSLLPYAELDPEAVARLITIAMALTSEATFVEVSGYALSTCRAVRNRSPRSERVRSDLALCAREMIQERRGYLLDLCHIDPVEMPEAKFPVRLIQVIEADERFQANMKNPHEYGTVQWNLWQTLYMSCRPAHADHIHLYGKPLTITRAMFAQWPVEFERPWLFELLCGPPGALNGNSTVANPALLDLFARALFLQWNVWGHSLWQDLEDIVPKRIA